MSPPRRPGRSVRSPAAGHTLPKGPGTYAGPAPQHALLSLQQAAGNTATAAVVSRLVSPGVPSTVLRRGSTGEDVRALQRKLNRVVTGAALGVDGAFGPATERAVRQFQSAAGLQSDGVVGPRTASALGKIPDGPSPEGAKRSPVTSEFTSSADGWWAEQTQGIAFDSSAMGNAPDATRLPAGSRAVMTLYPDPQGSFGHAEVRSITPPDRNEPVRPLPAQEYVSDGDGWWTSASGVSFAANSVEGAPNATALPPGTRAVMTLHRDRGGTPCFATVQSMTAAGSAESKPLPTLEYVSDAGGSWTAQEAGVQFASDSVGGAPNAADLPVGTRAVMTVFPARSLMFGHAVVESITPPDGSGLEPVSEREYVSDAEGFWTAQEGGIVFTAADVDGAPPARRLPSGSRAVMTLFRGRSGGFVRASVRSVTPPDLNEAIRPLAAREYVSDAEGWWTSPVGGVAFASDGVRGAPDAQRLPPGTRAVMTVYRSDGGGFVYATVDSITPAGGDATAPIPVLEYVAGADGWWTAAEGGIAFESSAVGGAPDASRLAPGTRAVMEVLRGRDGGFAHARVIKMREPLPAFA